MATAIDTSDAVIVGPAEAIPVAEALRPSVTVVDWNNDGDADLVVGTAYGYFCWFERSFLERGYAKAERVAGLSNE